MIAECLARWLQSGAAEVNEVHNEHAEERNAAEDVKHFDSFAPINRFRGIKARCVL